MGFYSRYLLPPLISCACGTRVVARQRDKIVPRARGVVLELGFGTGHNLRYYDPQTVTKVIALEPEPGMLVRAHKVARHAPLPVEVLPETAEALSLPAASVDTVLVTYSLCTIPDGASALAASRRVLKPGGQLLFCEHGRAPDADVVQMQARMEPLWRRLFGGCHLMRDIPKLITSSGFVIEQLDSMYLPSTPRFVGFNYWGVARAG
jgi:ubiquinone/menaquinone biosynthesis C-methylase UbiE